MADFILVYRAHRNGSIEPVLLPVGEIGPVFPVMSNGDMQGIGSWLHVAEYINPTGRMLVHGTPLEISEAIAADSRVAALTPTDRSVEEVAA